VLQSLCAGLLSPLKLIAKICIGLLEVFPQARLVAAGFADDEAEGGRQCHPCR
jgi:hypothetical protein